MCDTPGSGHAQWVLWVWSCWCGSEECSPHTAGCQTAGWDWKETMSMYRNSTASWTQPAGAPTNQKHKCSPWFFYDSSYLFSTPNSFILSEAFLSAQFNRKVCMTSPFHASFLLIIFSHYPSSRRSECSMSKHNETAVKIFSKVLHNQTRRHTWTHTTQWELITLQTRSCAIFLTATSLFGGDTAASSKISVQDPDYLSLEAH